jgi:hypothetical protein
VLDSEEEEEEEEDEEEELFLDFAFYLSLLFFCESS